VAVADLAGRARIDPITVTWFDPVGGSYRSSQTAPIELEVVPASSPPAGPRPERPAVPAGDGGADRGGTVPLGFAAVAGAVLAVLATAWVLARRRAPRRGLRRRLEAALLAARTEPSPRDAAVRLEAAWRELVRERWGISPGVPVAHWPERIVAAGGAASAARALVELFEELHGLRYAPELSDVEALRAEAVERSRRLARDLA
jgi:hypothetical protein